MEKNAHYMGGYRDNLFFNGWAPFSHVSWLVVLVLSIQNILWEDFLQLQQGFLFWAKNGTLKGHSL